MRALACVLLAGCIDVLGMDSPRSPAGVVTRECVLPWTHGGPTGVEWTDRGVSLWVWDDGRAIVGSEDEACAGPSFVAGAPVPLTDEEIAENAARSDGRALATTPLGGFVAGGVGVLYFDLQLRGPGIFDAEWRGQGICTLAAPDAPCVRAPALLWTTGGRGWGGAGFVDGDHAVVGSCAQVADSTRICTVARVPQAAAADPSAYEYAGPDGWTSDPTAARVAVSGPVTMTLAPSSLGTLAVFPDIFAPSLRVAAAADPDAPFGADVLLAPASPPPSFFISGGREHAALRDAGDLVLTYGSGSSLHVLGFRLDPVDWP